MQQKNLLILVVLTMLLTGFTNESTAQLQHVVKVNFLGALVGNGAASYEYVVNEKMTGVGTFRFLFLSPEYSQDFDVTGLGDFVNVNGEVKLQAYGLLPEFRFYLSGSKDAPAGFYLAPYLGLSYARLEAVSNTQGVTVNGNSSLFFFEGGGIAGYQFVIAEHFVLDIFAGGGISSFNLTDMDVEVIDTNVGGTVNDVLPIAFSIAGPLPRFGISIGYAF